MRIGPYAIANNLVVAPMAGVTDRPFRQLCKRLGAGYAVSEMVASNPRLWDTEKSLRRIDHRGEVEPIAVQIAGADPALMADAARYNVDRGAQIIDINMGCPAKKVCNAAAGSALLANEPLVAAIVDAVVRAVDVPVTLKIRTGADPEHRNALPIARIAEDAGIRALAVHGRTRACAYVGPVEYDTIRAVKAAVAIPVIANGDITTPQRARQVLDYTGADAIMIGRAAQGRPWIFREIRHYLDYRRAPAAADGRRGASRDRRAPRRPPCVPRRDERRAHRAQASRLVHDGPRRRRALPARDQRGGDERGAARGGPPVLRCARRRRRASRLSFIGDERRRCPFDVRRVATGIATGRGGPGRVRKTLRINGSNDIGKTVEKSLDEYFRRLDGEPPHDIYDMVIDHVERALIASVMERAGDNQTQAADMLGMNRNTLRAKLTKYDIR